MKILIIAKEDYLGAGKAAFRLYESFKRKNHSTCLLVRNKESEGDPDVIKYDDIIRNSFISRAKQFVYNRILKAGKNNIQTDPDYYFFGLYDQDLYFDVKQVVKKLPFKPDIIILTWTSQFIPPKAVNEFKKQTGAKIVAYPMDMSLFTGGCHYSWECDGYKSDCSNCPAILDETQKNRAVKNLAAKKQYYKKSDVSIIVGSEQLKLESIQSSLFKHLDSIPKVLMPINEAVFNRLSRSFSKGKFGISEDKKVIFFGSSVTSEKRKGVQLFIEALIMLSEGSFISERIKSDIIILLAGKLSDPTLTERIPFEVCFTGYINDDKKLSTAYQAANLFVNTSLQDSGPMMINESVICGTPVVSFKIGIATDLIVDGISGFAIEKGNITQLAIAMAKFLNMPSSEFEIISKNTANVGLNKTSDKIFVQNFLSNL